MHEQQPSPPVETVVERSGFTSITTPIEHLAVPYLIPFLCAHGATVEPCGEKQTYRAHLPSGKRRRRTFRMYHITFPDGVKRLDGLSTSWLVPFTLVFHDGARLQGRINRLPDPEEIILGLP